MGELSVTVVTNFQMKNQFTKLAITIATKQPEREKPRQQIVAQHLMSTRMPEFRINWLYRASSLAFPIHIQHEQLIQDVTDLSSPRKRAVHVLELELFYHTQNLISQSLKLQISFHSDQIDQGESRLDLEFVGTYVSSWTQMPPSNCFRPV